MRTGVFIVLFLASCVIQAQEIEILNTPGKVYTGELNSEVIVPLKIRNNSNHAVYVYVKRISNNIGSSQTSNFCWGEECYDSKIDKLPISRRIESGEVVEDFNSVLQSGLAGGLSTVKYQIYTRQNPNIVLEYEVAYEINDRAKTNTLFSSDNLVLNEVYPNPVKEYAFIDYQLNNPDTEVKILIHNVLGSIVGEFILNHKEKELKIHTIDYNPGVYFYTLSIDGDGVITKKLVIRR